MRVVFPICLVIVAGVAGMAAPPARAVECSCEHLPVLQAELRNAQRLQAAFRGQVAALQGMGPEVSRGEYLRFVQRGEPGRGNEPVPNYTGSRDFSYAPWGRDNVSEGRVEEFTAQQLCRMSDEAARLLERMLQASGCDGIADAVRQHENYHVTMCQSVGYRAYEAMHGSDRAREEAEAYGVQIRLLRAAIAHALDRGNARILLEMNTRTLMPPSPLLTAVIIQSRGEVRAIRATMAGERIQANGQGSQTTTVSIESNNCRMTSGSPYTIQTRGGFDTDGLEAQLRYAIEGTLPSLGMQCRFPGAGQGYGMSVPVPVDTRGSTPPAATVPLRNGAEFVFDMATSQGAQIAASGGVRITGQAKLRFECSAAR